MAKRPQKFLRALGVLVRRARVSGGWSQEALAAEAGLDRSYMSGVERGVRNLSMLKLHAIATALGVSTRELIPHLNDDTTSAVHNLRARVRR